MEKMVGIRNFRERRRVIQSLNLTSDLLSSVTFEDIISTQEVLRILTGIVDLRVTRVEPQRSYRNLYGHSSVSDIWAEDSRNRQFNLEIQIADNEDHLRRSRFIQSRMDSRSLSSGTEYERMPELYLIFLTKSDFLHIGKGFCEIVRSIRDMDKEVDNGVHEIYVNLEYPVKDKTMQCLLDFISDTNNPEICTEGFEHLAERVRYLKNDEQGVRVMCEVLERERAEGRAEGEMLCLIGQIIKKQAKGMESSEISEQLEEKEFVVSKILVAMAKANSEEPEAVLECLAGSRH